MDIGHEKTTVLGYRTIFEGSDIHHSNAGLQITYDMFINGYFMLLGDLTPELSASDWHTSLSENANTRIKLKFDAALKITKLKLININLILIFDFNPEIKSYIKTRLVKKYLSEARSPFRT
jgi:hypothetical protein